MKNKFHNQKSGFVILFAVMVSSIIFAVTLGVANVSVKEIKFFTSAKESNSAFFAADTAAECALYNDKSTDNSFVQSGGSGVIRCSGTNITLSGSYPTWNFPMSQLGADGNDCALVTVAKTVSPPATVIISKGYNEGGGTAGACTPGSNSIERQIELTY